MICYKDMTFCEFKDCKHFDNGCHRSLTKAVRNQAEKFGLPLCVFIDKPTCHEYPENYTQETDVHIKPDYEKIHTQI